MKVMKRITTVIFSIVCSLILLQTNAQKEKKEYPFSKEDNISKSYPAAGNSLNIENKFGKVEIITWNSNEIKVDVHIKVSSSNKEYAEKTFDAIKVNDEKNGNDISLKTSIKSAGCNNCNNSMKIDYTVHLPADTKLKIKNSFGPIIIPDYNGELSIENKFGDMTAQTLSNIKSLLFEFGTANINSLNNVDAAFKFSSVELNNLTGNNNFKFDFCNAVKIKLANILYSLNINESYSTINLKPEPNFSASYNINTNFSSFVNRSDIDIQRTNEPTSKYGPDSKKIYEGKSGNGTAKVEIKSKFGNIIIGEPKPGDIKEKKHKDTDSENEEI